ncbi:hypothetical protein [Leptolyngbya sp. FACHB-261]|uniref:hypothetical protein n=1 Tax=Leptolyngbya sp. FACHB-261 TaxID=2692806 RepID=UPI001689A25F|nr:hypothetical protein [Leptolyngbya sp. FACHB-261]MBD2102274.1 hypothetical protein [Leptolyngbya sp. FACHB-261]
MLTIMLMLTLTRSVLVAGLLCFAVPAALLSFATAGLFLFSQTHLPLLQAGAQQFANFLATFGSGDTITGTLVISLTCALVGCLFEGYVFFYQQTNTPWRNSRQSAE